MLIALKVQSFILIDLLELRFEPGFNVLTGETGAGKSIIVGALALVLGGRARADLVRPGSSEAVVEALFDVSDHPLIAELLEQAGIASDGDLVIRRVVHHSGRSRAYLNGRLCTVSELRALATELADVTSQHEHVALADPRRHLDFLDRYAKLAKPRAALAELVDDLLAREDQLCALRERERSRAEREAFLRYQLDAIEGVQPRIGELEELAAERSRLKHASELLRVSRDVAQHLDGGGADAELCDRLGKMTAEMMAATELDAALQPLAAELEECWTRLREVARDASRYAEQLEADPRRLEEVQDRIYRLETLLRQHGPTIEDLLAAHARIEADLAELAGVDERIIELERQRNELLTRAARMAQKLSRRRHKAAGKLGVAISAELAELGMGAARVVVEVAPARSSEQATAGQKPSVLVVDDARLGRSGIDRVRFLIAPNRGLEPRPLGRIASGGELSRALLALKRALGSAGGNDSAVGVQVFDEVDSGVGGETADRIGQAIAGISQHRQVLCITHMAAIAAYADAHFVVTKHDAADTVHSTIERVKGDARVAEVGRMLTGTKVTASSRRAAKQLLRLAAAHDAAA